MATANVSTVEYVAKLVTVRIYSKWLQCLRHYCTAKKLFPPVLTPMLPPGTFKNKVAIVTGGGTGIGKGMTEMFAQLGANVTIMSRKQEVLDKAAKEISSKTGSKILAVAADVRDPSAVEQQWTGALMNLACLT
ncbi:hypothetical protein HPB52_008440 [Rhipicephalus sanguineus]|uniref:Uncharacterized protein n=1 Tax=Rhipicephalus sanguineus TaxID=34632 RepID=A0A9D4SY37_RHISA|nr:hypothetical protein HPB52_008440 [Rhipicephalus sanguineus]